ncbi:MAG: LacI family transcriptional regulator [Cellvibrionales bacterium TMED49]|nr:MAG: LacI family transcriptional regulator [Cellvibrionales bacterium TMED49]
MLRLMLWISLGTILLLSGCNRNDGENWPSASPKIALVMKSLANEFFVNMADAAKVHQSENSEQYSLIINGIRNESDITQQVAIIDQMIAAQVDAIIIAPADSKALVPALARANKAGIILVNIDNRLDASVLSEFDLVIPHVGPDNKAGARKVGDYLAGSLSTGDEVAILEGIVSSINSQARRDGFEEAANARGLIIATIQSASWEQTKATEITSAVLTQHPQLKGVMAANDSMALGALSAIKQLGRSDDIKVVGFDNISAVRKLVKQGEILATADQYGDLLAVYGIEFALDTLAGKEVNFGRETSVDLITRDILDGRD